jgi:hypothetical protein
MRVQDWPIVIGEQVLLFVVHKNAQFAKTEAELANWQCWVIAEWTGFNGGGWTWEGIMGRPTHVASLPPTPTEHRFKVEK